MAGCLAALANRTWPRKIVKKSSKALHHYRFFSYFSIHQLLILSFIEEKKKRLVVRASAKRKAFSKRHSDEVYEPVQARQRARRALNPKKKNSKRKGQHKIYKSILIYPEFLGPFRLENPKVYRPFSKNLPWLLISHAAIGASVLRKEALFFAGCSLKFFHALTSQALLSKTSRSR